MNIVLIGPPGAGKGTQADALRTIHGIPKISTGEMLRDAVNGATNLGAEVAEAVASGRLVSDEVMIRVVQDRLSRPDVRSGFILDGFPRTVEQARVLDQMMRRHAPIVPIVIRIPEDEAIRRLLQRRICSACGLTYGGPLQAAEADRRCNACGGALVRRKDDDAEIIRKRLRVFEQSAVLLVGYYRSHATFIEVDGLQPAARVTEQLVKAIDRVSAPAGQAASRQAAR